MANDTKTLLIELFTEELPPKALAKLGDAFASSLFESLKKQEFATPESALKVFATPRRLAALVSEVRGHSPDKQETLKLMPVAVALDANGQPTPALQKKMAALGIAQESLAQFERKLDGKAEALFFTRNVAGSALAGVLSDMIKTAIDNLPIPKMMSYQLVDGQTTVQFVRPAHRLVVLHGEDVVQGVSALGLTADRVTEGHRFQGEKLIELGEADHYEGALLGVGKVIPSFTARRAEIDFQLKERTESLGAKLETGDAYDALLDEVTALVEYPTVYVGSFEQEFLEVPQECLILTMRANQKYFPLFDAGGKLTNQFLIVSNMQLDDPHNITSGNEKVIRPRLSDARFFFTQDRKKSLWARKQALENVVYHNKLGTQAARTDRVVRIAAEIARGGGYFDPALVTQAAELAKADLMTDMVGEFPELQGIMGNYYARHEGLSAEVAQAIQEHYQPRYAGDALPTTATGTCVALADKLETLAGLFGIGEVPTGDKDPYGLRRHAIGVIRILIEKDLPFELPTLLTTAFAAFSGKVKDASGELLTFIYERLGVNLRDRGFSPQEVDAVVSQRPRVLRDVNRRIAAVREFAKMSEAESLAAANKRIGNILKKSDGAAGSVDTKLFQAPEENALYNALQSAQAKAQPAFDRGDYTESLKAWASVKEPADAFFDKVMVNADDPKIKGNRLALLAAMHAQMNKVADLSRLAS